MENEKIPSELWRLKNIILKRMEVLTSNNEHYQYKQLFTDFAQVCQSTGKEIENLVKQYEQPKER